MRARMCLSACMPLHSAFYQFVGCTAPALQAVEFDVVHKENLVWVCMQWYGEHFGSLAYVYDVCVMF